MELMNRPEDPAPQKESVLLYDISPQLEAELMRRARESGRPPADEAAEILESHAETEQDAELD